MDHIQTKFNVQDLVYAHAHASNLLQSFLLDLLQYKHSTALFSDVGNSKIGPLIYLSYF